MVLYGFDFAGRDRAVAEYRVQQARMGPEAFQKAFRLPQYREQYEEMMKALDPLSDLTLTNFDDAQVPELMGAR